jgi:Na+/melibiose symporter-like transporter
LITIVYAIVNRSEPAWPLQTFTLLAVALVLLSVFSVVESRVRAPLVSPRIFRLGNLAVTNVIYMMLAAALLTCYCVVTLYLQTILHYSPLKVGLAFLPTSQVLAVFTLGFSHRLIIRFGIKPLIVIGLLLTAVGLALLALVPVSGSFSVDVVPGLLVASLGAGMSSNPLLLAALGDIDPRDSGLASGILGTVSTIGAALGLAVFLSVAAARTNALLVSGTGVLVALNSGYRLVIEICSGLTVVAALTSIAFLRTREGAPEQRGAYVRDC